MNSVPPLSDARWSQVLQSPTPFKFEFLATNMVYTRLAILAKRDPSPQNLKKISLELWEVFSKNVHNPKVQNDIKRIFG